MAAFGRGTWVCHLGLLWEPSLLSYQWNLPKLVSVELEPPLELRHLHVICNYLNHKATNACPSQQLFKLLTGPFGTQGVSPQAGWLLVAIHFTWEEAAAVQVVAAMFGVHRALQATLQFGSQDE